jgi:hypothetical protein
MHCKQFVSQAENYNRGIAAVLEHGDYVKVVEADNIVVPTCVEQLVEIAETDPSIGTVGSYWIRGKRVVGDGIHFGVSKLDGADAWRLLVGVEGSSAVLGGPPTSQLYRAAALRTLDVWFRPEVFYDDVDLLARLLIRWNYGYVHQILSFVRSENDGILDAYYDLDFVPAERHFLITDYGTTFGGGEWLDSLSAHWARTYYSCLAKAVIRWRGKDYWDFHRRAFRARGSSISRRLLVSAIAYQLADICLNPKSTIEKLLRARRRSHPDRSVMRE